MTNTTTPCTCSLRIVCLWSTNKHERHSEFLKFSLWKEIHDKTWSNTLDEFKRHLYECDVPALESMAWYRAWGGYDTQSILSTTTSGGWSYIDVSTCVSTLWAMFPMKISSKAGFEWNSTIFTICHRLHVALANLARYCPLDQYSRFERWDSRRMICDPRITPAFSCNLSSKKLLHQISHI
jgi:hypothetical protein